MFCRHDNASETSNWICGECLRNVRNKILSGVGIEVVSDITMVELKANEPNLLNEIQGVARIPADFRPSDQIEFGTGELTLVSPNGKLITVPVNQ